MRYGFEQYNQHGYLKTPILLWLGWLFLTRAWVVFVVAGASRQEGSNILQWVYPDHQMLYIGLGMGLPIVISMWLIGLRKPEYSLLDKVVKHFRAVTLFVILGQTAHTLYIVKQQYWQFTWTNALTLVLLTWFCIYLVNSRYVLDCLATQKNKT